MKMKNTEIKKDNLKNRIKNNSSMFINFIKNAITASPKVQKNFLDVSAKVAETVLKIIKEADLIVDLDYQGKDFWFQNRDKISCFVDGGIDKLSLLSAAPLSIRAGSYIVQPNANKPNEREYLKKA